MCQFLPEKRYQIYPNITDQDEKAEKPGVGQEGTRLGLKEAERRCLSNQVDRRSQ